MILLEPALHDIVRGHRASLVVTGWWNDEYESIASRLDEEGAERARPP